MTASFKIIPGYHGYRGLSPIVRYIQRRIGDADASNQKEYRNPENDGLLQFCSNFSYHDFVLTSIFELRNKLFIEAIFNGNSRMICNMLRT